MKALDNPIYASLRSAHARFALGDGPARRFIPEVGPLAGFEGAFEDAVRALEKTTTPGGALGFFLDKDEPAPSGWSVARKVGLLQMVYAGRGLPADEKPYVDLDERDNEEMVALAKLTMPGPFASRTRELGRFVGVREDGRLAAMSGERLKLPGFTEISAVCTHPDHLGRGHASALMSVVARRILARGETPMLHVAAGNERAIAVYERLGFAKTKLSTYLSLRRR